MTQEDHDERKRHLRNLFLQAGRTEAFDYLWKFSSLFAESARVPWNHDRNSIETLVDQVIWMTLAVADMQRGIENQALEARGSPQSASSKGWAEKHREEVFGSLLSYRNQPKPPPMTIWMSQSIANNPSTWLHMDVSVDCKLVGEDAADQPTIVEGKEPT